MKRLEFNVQNAVITMKGQVVDLFVTGLSDYFVQNADFKFIGKKVIVDFLWTAINFNTEYNLFDGSVLCKFPIYGAGNLKLKVSQFHFATEANIKMDMKADRLSVLALNNTNIDLENLEVSITGLFGDDELSTLISAVISENAVSMLRDFQGDVTALVNQQIYEVANNYLKNMSLKQLLEKMKQNNI
ncbi:uncharacterized protein LOC106636303 [Copidosoma floridanum]|uniref:uncharacterized protein LOC106636303 n=1 Tax=Copidosoma floridanum TaxID=29053 RepID=UPI0006C9CE73|nr:uncharacterized protein LOC106636303 [Copidosoma floridanum]